jgi:uncharacterized RDD family membrane protein YckC
VPARPDRRHLGGEGLIGGRVELLTPEGVRLSLVPAGPGRRAFAWAVDFGVVLVVLFLAALALVKSEAGQGLFLIVLFLVWWGYPILFEVFAKGMTPGKRWLGLQVVRADGLPVGWRESILRNLLLVADFLPMLYGTGIVCMALDPKFRRVGDLVAQTLVVYRPTPWQPRAFGLTESAPLPFPLLAEEQRALLDLLERIPELSSARLAELGDLAEPLTGETGEKSMARVRAMATGLLT